MHVYALSPLSTVMADKDYRHAAIHCLTLTQSGDCRMRSGIVTSHPTIVTSHPTIAASHHTTAASSLSVMSVRSHPSAAAGESR